MISDVWKRGLRAKRGPRGCKARLEGEWQQVDVVNSFKILLTFVRDICSRPQLLVRKAQTHTTRCFAPFLNGVKLKSLKVVSKMVLQLPY